MYDVEEDPEAESVYECLKCGNIVTSDSYPGTCSVCGSDGFQNRAMSLE